MAGERIGVRCERAREWASLEVDGELSELEAVLLGRHLGDCPECRRFASVVAATAGFLRAAPLEAPSHALAFPRRRKELAFPVRRRLTVALIAAAAAFGSVVGAVVQASPPSQAPGSELSFLTRDVSQLRELPRSGPKAQPRPSLRQPGLPPEGAV